MTFECAICLEIKKSGLRCYECKRKVCMDCAGKILKVCRLGCPCVRWRCPTCRATNAEIVTRLKHPKLLMGVINDYMRIAQEDLEDDDNI